MAFHNDSRVPFDPNMREKYEHSRTSSNKYASCLRIPEDTTWPKIPERRLHENIIGNSKAPCIITFPGKTQKLKTNQLPNSQFNKFITRKNEVERNNPMCNVSTFRTTAKEGNTSNSTDFRFKTTITPQIITNDTLKQDENKISEEKGEIIIESLDHVKNIDNCNIKNSCEMNTLENKGNLSNQFNTFNNISIHSVKSKDSTNLKLSSNTQECMALNNNSEHTNTNDNTQKKVENVSNNNNSPIFGETQEYNEFQTKHEWKPEKLKPTRLYISDTTDSEIYSSDTSRTDRIKTIMERRIHSTQKKLNVNCNKVFKNPHIKKETSPCSCTHYENLCSLKNFMHHSEPQIGSFGSRCYSNPHGKTMHCCAKDFHRVASDSDCRMKHKSEIPLRCRKQDCHPDSMHKYHNLLSYSEILNTLRSRKNGESKQQEIPVKGNGILEPNFLNNFENLHYMEKNNQMGIDVPQEKNWKRGDENIKGCDSDTLYIFSSMDNQDVKSESSNEVKNVVRSICPSKNNNLEIVKESANERNTATNKISNDIDFPNNEDNNPQEKKLANNRLLKLKRAVFFGSILYALILSLPSLYDYFFYEEYDVYEEQSYMEFIIEYILASFQEAFGGIFDFIHKIFFQLRACKKCNNSR